MKIVETGKNNQVFFTVMSYRVFLPYGRMTVKSTYSILLNYEKKMLINTGVIENKKELVALYRAAGITHSELDYVINMTHRPEHIGQNAVLEYQNPGIQFFAHPDDAHLISDTAYQLELNYTPGFYRLVAGNTLKLNQLQDRQVFDLVSERVVVNFQPEAEGAGEKFSLYLPESGLTIGSMDVTSDEELISAEGSAVYA